MKNKKGFTLIELLAVIVILAIIAIIATPIVLNIINNVQRSAFEQNIKSIDKAIKTANVSTVDRIGYSSFEELPIKVKDDIIINAVYEKGKTYYYELKNNSYKIDVTKCENTEYCTYEEIFEKKDVIVKNSTKIEPIVFEKVEDEDPGVIACTNDIGEIRSIEDLASLSTTANPCKIVKLAYNLDFNNKNSYASSKINEDLISGEGFAPISNFTSVFDGNNKIIKGLYINRPEQSSLGLFGTIKNASNSTTQIEIKNLKIENANVIGKEKSAILVGNMDGAYKITIENIEMNNITLKASGDYIGSVVGYGYGNPIVKAINIKGATVEGNGYIGGVFGIQYGNATTIVFDAVEGYVKANDSYAGLVSGRQQGSITSVLIKGDLQGIQQVGGLTGASSGNLKGAYLDGSITSSTTSVGRMYASSSSGTRLLIANENILVNGNLPTNTSLTNYNGLDVEEKFINDLNTLDMVIDTYIGGDNDNDGYYFDYDSNGKIVIKSVVENPLTFDLEEESGVYLIKNYSDLRKASLNQTYSYKLVNDIDMKDKYFYTLGTSVNLFKGTLDGNNKTIKNLSMNGFNTGILNYAKNASDSTTPIVIKNLKLKDVNVEAQEKSAVLVGNMDGAYNTTIENIEINNITLKASGDNVGSVIGYAYGSPTVKAINIKGATVEGNGYVGGVFGTQYGTTTTIVFDADEGYVKASDSYAGLVSGRQQGSITSVLVKGDLQGTQQVGGLTGASSGNLKGAYLDGSITSSTTSVGRMYASAGSGTRLLIVNENILVNGKKITSTSISSYQGKSVSEESLKLQATYEEAGFNFTDTTTDYIWYFDNGVLKFKSN